MVNDNAVINLLLADDDSDDRYFFAETLSEIPLPTHLETVGNGMELITCLMNANQLPDVLFLDINMPFKNGIECMNEIKTDARLSALPVIIYSTSLHQHIADQLYEAGAYYYIRKSDLAELTKVLRRVLDMIAKKKFIRPSKDKFLLSPLRCH